MKYNLQRTWELTSKTNSMEVIPSSQQYVGNHTAKGLLKFLIPYNQSVSPIQKLSGNLACDKKLGFLGSPNSNTNLGIQTSVLDTTERASNEKRHTAAFLVNPLAGNSATQLSKKLWGIPRNLWHIFSWLAIPIWKTVRGTQLKLICRYFHF